MSQEFRGKIFLIVGFLLGSINVLYGEVFYVFLLLACLVNIVSSWQAFCKIFRKEWKYLMLPWMGAGYLFIHYLLSLFIADIPYKPSWGMIELLLLYFFVIPVYIASAKEFITPLLFKRFLFSLCWGILLFNFTKFFYLTGFTLFTHPGETLNMIYSGRFGGNMDLLGGFVYLEPQTIYVCISAILSYFFILRHFDVSGDKLTLWSSIVIFIFSFIFISFSVTKGAILAFFIGFLFLSVVYFWKLSWRIKLGVGGGILCIVLLAGLFLPPAYVKRMNQMKSEIENVRNGDFKGGSIAPRAGLLKENFQHANEFGLCGLGVYKKRATLDWYEHSSYGLKGITNAHNSYMEFWLIGGIPGLLFILSYFGAPLVRMIRRKKISFLIIAVFLILFVANNTCVLIILVDSNPFVLFMLAIAFLCQNEFYALQKGRL